MLNKIGQGKSWKSLICLVQNTCYTFQRISTCVILLYRMQTSQPLNSFPITPAGVVTSPTLTAVLAPQVPRLDPSLEQGLQQSWITLLKSCGVSEQLATVLFRDLAERYSEPHRAYHNLEHIDALFKLVEKHQLKFDNPKAVYLAIFLHDVVYESGRHYVAGASEKASAVWLREKLQEHIAPEVLNVAERLILATSSHFAFGTSSDFKKFLDLDLAILGADQASYQKASQAIRQEYGEFTQSEFNAGRSLFLKNRLERGPVFHTPEFQGYERQARANMRAELQELNSEAVRKFEVEVKSTQLPRERRVEYSGNTLFVSELGERHLPGLILVHGTGQTHQSFAEIAQALAPHFHVLVPDMRGHGKSSDSTDYSLYSCGLDLLKISESVHPGRLTLVGASIGGLHALAAANLRPDRIERVILADMLPSVSQKFTDRTGTLLINGHFATREAAVDQMHASAPQRTREQIEDRLRYSLVESPDGGFKFRVDPQFVIQMQASTRGEFWHHLEGAPCPVYLIRGGESRALETADLDRFEKARGRESLISVPKAGHSVAGDNTLGFLKALQEFIA